MSRGSTSVTALDPQAKAAGDELEYASLTEDEKRLYTDEHHSYLYQREMKFAALNVFSAVEYLMSDTYAKVFGDPKKPKMLKEFMLPLLWQPPRTSPHGALLDRFSFLSKCSQETQDKAAKEARAAKGLSEKAPLFEFHYKGIDNKVFQRLMEEEFDAARADPSRIRSYFVCMDLQAACKINVKHMSPKAGYIYQALRSGGLLNGITQADWEELCKNANTDRNNILHGGRSAGHEVRKAGGPEKALGRWFQIAEALHSKELNQVAYAEVAAARSRAVDIQNSRVFYFRDLNLNLGPGLDGLDGSDLCNAAEARGISCDTACALFSATQEELSQKLEQELRSRINIPVENLKERFGGSIEDIEAYLNKFRIHVHNGMVFGHSEEEMLNLLEMRKNQMDLEEENRKLNEALEELRQEHPHLSEAQIEELLNDPIFRKMLKQRRADPKSLPKLQRLAEYQQGPLSPSQIEELINTHQLVLDSSVLRSPAGRSFIAEKLIPQIEFMRRNRRSISLIMEATALRRLLQTCALYKEKKRAYDSTDWRNREAERQSRLQELQELEPAKSAYYFVQDGLREKGLLRLVGEPNPFRQDEEMLQLFLEETSAQRICVLTSGATPLTKMVCRGQFPLCAVARVQGNYYSAAGKQNGPTCLIFPQYLPLTEGCALVDFDEYLREKLQLSPDAYTASGIAGGSPASALSFSQPGAPKAGPAFPPASELRQVEDLPLPRSGDVTAGTLLLTENGIPVRIIGEKLQEGGEGSLFQVDLSGQAAKIYHADPNHYKLTSGRKQKLEDMTAHNPCIPHLCWPTHLLYNQEQEFVGYLMPRAPGDAMTFQEFVMQLTKPTVQEHVLIGKSQRRWDRRDLVCAAKAVADMAAALHENNILIGDLNDSNFMVDPQDSSAVYLVDCDSYQFDGYPCPVGTQSYAHPGIFTRLNISGELEFGTFLWLEQEEDYSLSILIFRILMLGQYPFDSLKGGAFTQAMRERRFPFTVEDAGDAPPGYCWMIWKNMPKALNQAFVDAFKDWNPPTAAKWSGLLKDYLFYIDQYDFSRELIPVKYHEYHKDKPFYQDVVCDLYPEEINMPIERYNDLVRRKEPILDRNRKGFLKYLKESGDIDMTLTCHSCGRPFLAAGDQVCLSVKLHRPVYCPACLSREEHHCQLCGKKYREQQKWYQENRKYGRPSLCWDCRKLTSFQLTCCVCQREFTATGNWRQLRRLYKPGKGFHCDKHLNH